MKKLISLIVLTMVMLVSVSCFAMKGQLVLKDSTFYCAFIEPEFEFFAGDLESERKAQEEYKKRYEEYVKAGVSRSWARRLARQDVENARDPKYAEYKKRYDEYVKAGVGHSWARILARKDVYGD